MALDYKSMSFNSGGSGINMPTTVSNSGGSKPALSAPSVAAPKKQGFLHTVFDAGLSGVLGVGEGAAGAAALVADLVGITADAVGSISEVVTGKQTATVKLGGKTIIGEGSGLLGEHRAEKFLDSASQGKWMQAITDLTPTLQKVTAEYNAHIDNPARKAAGIDDTGLNRMTEMVGSFVGPQKIFNGIGAMRNTTRLLAENPNLSAAVIKKMASKDMSYDLLKTAFLGNADDEAKLVAQSWGSMGKEGLLQAPKLAEDARKIVKLNAAKEYAIQASPKIIGSWVVLESPKPVEERIPLGYWITSWVVGDAVLSGLGVGYSKYKGAKDSKKAAQLKAEGKNTVEDVLNVEPVGTVASDAQNDALNIIQQVDGGASPVPPAQINARVNAAKAKLLDEQIATLNRDTDDYFGLNDFLEANNQIVASGKQGAVMSEDDILQSLIIQQRDGVQRELKARQANRSGPRTRTVDKSKMNVDTTVPYSSADEIIAQAQARQAMLDAAQAKTPEDILANLAKTQKQAVTKAAQDEKDMLLFGLTSVDEQNPLFRNAAEDILHNFVGREVEFPMAKYQSASAKKGQVISGVISDVVRTKDGKAALLVDTVIDGAPKRITVRADRIDAINLVTTKPAARRIEVVKTAEKAVPSAEITRKLRVEAMPKEMQEQLRAAQEAEDAAVAAAKAKPATPAAKSAEKAATPAAVAETTSKLSAKKMNSVINKAAHLAETKGVAKKIVDMTKKKVSYEDIKTMVKGKLGDLTDSQIYQVIRSTQEKAGLLSEKQSEQLRKNIQSVADSEAKRAAKAAQKAEAEVAAKEVTPAAGVRKVVAKKKKRVTTPEIMTTKDGDTMVVIDTGKGKKASTIITNKQKLKASGAKVGQVVDNLIDSWAEIAEHAGLTNRILEASTGLDGRPLPIKAVASGVGELFAKAGFKQDTMFNIIGAVLTKKKLISEEERNALRRAAKKELGIARKEKKAKEAAPADTTVAELHKRLDAIQGGEVKPPFDDAAQAAAKQGAETVGEELGGAKPDLNLSETKKAELEAKSAELKRVKDIYNEFRETPLGKLQEVEYAKLSAYMFKGKTNAQKIEIVEALQSKGIFVSGMPKFVERELQKDIPKLVAAVDGKVPIHTLRDKLIKDLKGKPTADELLAAVRKARENGVEIEGADEYIQKLRGLEQGMSITGGTSERAAKIKRLDESIAVKTAEIKAEIKKGKGGKLGITAPNDIKIIKNIAIIGAHKITKGYYVFADWTEEMVREFGESIRPLANELWVRSQNILRGNFRLDKLTSGGDVAETVPVYYSQITSTINDMSALKQVWTGKEALAYLTKYTPEGELKWYTELLDVLENSSSSKLSIEELQELATLDDELLDATMLCTGVQNGKWSRITLFPATNNYAELFLNWRPSGYRYYHSGHFNAPNIGDNLVAHARVDVVKTENNDTGLLILELQSDWSSAVNKVKARRNEMLAAVDNGLVEYPGKSARYDTGPSAKPLRAGEKGYYVEPRNGKAGYYFRSPDSIPNEPADIAKINKNPLFRKYNNLKEQQKTLSERIHSISAQIDQRQTIREEYIHFLDFASTSFANKIELPGIESLLEHIEDYRELDDIDLSGELQALSKVISNITGYLNKYKDVPDIEHSDMAVLLDALKQMHDTLSFKTATPDTLDFIYGSMDYIEAATWTALAHADDEMRSVLLSAANIYEAKQYVRGVTGADIELPNVNTSFDVVSLRKKSVELSKQRSKLSEELRFLAKTLNIDKASTQTTQYTSNTAWVDALLKRVIRYAVDNNINYVVFPSAEQVVKIEKWNLLGDMDRALINKQGMLDVYNKVAKSTIQNYGKRWGIAIEDSPLINYTTIRDREITEVAERAGWGFKIPPEMAASVKYEGQPMTGRGVSRPLDNTKKLAESALQKTPQDNILSALSNWYKDGQRTGIVSPEYLRMEEVLGKLGKWYKKAVGYGKYALTNSADDLTDFYKGEGMMDELKQGTKQAKHMRFIEQQVAERVVVEQYLKVAEKLHTLATTKGGWGGLKSEMESALGTVSENLSYYLKKTAEDLDNNPERIRLDALLKEKRKEVNQLKAALTEKYQLTRPAGRVSKDSEAWRTFEAKRRIVDSELKQSAAYQEFTQLSRERNAIRREVRGQYKAAIYASRKQKQLLEGLIDHPERTINDLRSQSRNLKLNIISDGNWMKFKNVADKLYTSMFYRAAIKDPVTRNYVRTALDSADNRSRHDAEILVKNVLGLAKNPEERALFEARLTITGAYEDALKKRGNFRGMSEDELKQELDAIMAKISELSPDAQKRIQNMMDAHKATTQKYLRYLVDAGKLDASHLQDGIEWYLPHTLIKDAESLILPTNANVLDVARANARTLKPIKIPYTNTRMRDMDYNVDYESVMYDYYRRVSHALQVDDAFRYFYNQFDARSLLEKRVSALKEMEATGDPAYEAEKLRLDYEMERFKGFRTKKWANTDGSIIGGSSFVLNGEVYRPVSIPVKFFITKNPEHQDMNKVMWQAYMDAAAELKDLSVGDLHYINNKLKSKELDLQKQFDSIFDTRYLPENKFEVGGVMYLPQELALELERTYKQGFREGTAIKAAYDYWRSYTAKWKRHVLFVASIGSYAVNNVVGDSLKFIMEDPAGFFTKDFSKAAKVAFQKKNMSAAEKQVLDDMMWVTITPDMLKDYKQIEALYRKNIMGERGIKLTAKGDITVDMRRLALLEDVTTSGMFSEVGQAMKIPGKLSKNPMVHKVEQGEDWLIANLRKREDWQRLHKFSVDLRRVIEGKEVGITYRPEVDVLGGIESAGWSSRTTMVDYTAIGSFMSEGRNTFMPFATWYLRNFTDAMRWHATNGMQLIKWADNKLLGNKLGTTELKNQSGKAAGALGRFAATLGLLGGMFMWNHTGEREQIERTLDPNVRSTPHLILTADADAKTYKVINLPHPLVTAYSLIGVDKTGLILDKLNGGEMTEEQAIDTWLREYNPVTTAVQKLGAQLNPILRVGVEEAANKKFWNGRPIIYGNPEMQDWSATTKDKIFYALDELFPLVGQFGITPLKYTWEGVKQGENPAGAVLGGELSALGRSVGVSGNWANKDVTGITPLYKEYDATKVKRTRALDIMSDAKDASTADREKAQKLIENFFTQGGAQSERAISNIQKVQTDYIDTGKLSASQIQSILNSPEVYIHVLNARRPYADPQTAELIDVKLQELSKLQLQQTGQTIPKAYRDDVAKLLQATFVE